MYFEEVEKRVIQWANDRGILEGTTFEAQYKKLKEEYDELGEAIEQGDFEKFQDAIGDMQVVLTILAHKALTDMFTCYTAAYLQIKDRKGKMVDGIFVKDSNV